MTLYVFDAADAELTLLPMAARRALDVAGVHLSLQGWQRLALTLRQRLITLGALDQVPVADVFDCICEVGDEQRLEPALIEPGANESPPIALLDLLSAARPLEQAAWSGLRALDRYVLRQLAGRGKQERLHTAYDEIFSR